MLSIIRIGKWVMKRDIGYDFYIGGYCFFYWSWREKTIIYLGYIVIVYGNSTINNIRHLVALLI